MQGPIGLTGLTGLTGLKGDKGDIGLTGAQGATGATGAQGATGIQGLKGDTGSTGAQGSAGLTGPPGPTGPQGVLIGKLYLTGPALSITDVNVMCEMHKDAEVLDFTGASLSPGQDVPLTLASTTIVQDAPSNISIVCSTDGDQATAFAVQLIATQVISAQIVAP